MDGKWADLRYDGEKAKVTMPNVFRYLSWVLMITGKTTIFIRIKKIG